MAYESVDIFVIEKSPPQVAVPGVVVKVLSENGTLVYGQATTDDEGKASFLLPDAVYQLRFFKAHVNFSQPQLITVLPSPETNSFDVEAESFVAPISTDPRLCVASGFFRRPDGSAAPSVDIHFIGKFKPLLLEGAALMKERVSTRTDSKGYAQISLIRFAEYDVTVEGLDDYVRVISVPDKSGTNLPDLLFPVVETITFSPAPPFAVPVNGSLDVIPTVVASDGRILDGTALEDVSWTSSDLTKFSVGFDGTKLTLVGSAIGAATLIATRSDDSIIRIPDTPITGVPADVVVS